MTEVRSYKLKHDGTAWRIGPAGGPGGVVVAVEVDLVNVHVSSRGPVLIVHNCVMKLNGVSYLGDQDANCAKVRFQPAPQRVEVGPIKAMARAKMT